MRYFTILDFQHMVLATFLGLIGLILICMAFGSHSHDRKPVEEAELKDLEGHELNTAHQWRTNPHAPFLLLVYGGVIVFVVVYLVVKGILGGPIS